MQLSSYQSTFESSLPGRQIFGVDILPQGRFATSERLLNRHPLGSSCVVELLHLLHWPPSTWVVEFVELKLSTRWGCQELIYSATNPSFQQTLLEYVLCESTATTNSAVAATDHRWCCRYLLHITATVPSYSVRYCKQSSRSPSRLKSIRYLTKYCNKKGFQIFCSFL